MRDLPGVDFTVALLLSALLFCGSPGALASAQQRTIITGEPTCPRCTITLTTVAEIGKATDPILIMAGSRPVIDERGRIYVARTAEDGRVAVYDSAGTFAGAFGRSGRGPGEMVRSEFLAVDGERVYVVDSEANRVNVFGDMMEFERAFNLHGRAPHSTEILLLPGRIVAGSFALLPARPGSVHIMDRDGALLKIAGERPAPAGPPAPEGEHASGMLNVMRTLAAAGPDRFWAATMNRYQIELWDTAGTLHRVLTRNVPWFPEWRGLPGFDPSRQKWPPLLQGVDQLPDGLVAVMLFVPDANWAPAPPGRGMMDQNEINRYFDTMIEIIDPRAGTVLAAQRFPNIVVPASRSGYVGTFSESPEGYVTWTVSRVSVTRPTGYRNHRGESTATAAGS